MIPTNRTVHEHASGAAIDSEDMLNCSALSSVRPRIEVMPLERATEAYERMTAAKACFRMVLTNGN